MLLFPERLSLDSCMPCFFSPIRSLLKSIISEAFHDHLIYNWNLPTSLTPFSSLFFVLEFITSTLCCIYLSNFCFSLTKFMNRFLLVLFTHVKLIYNMAKYYFLCAKENGSEMQIIKWASLVDDLEYVSL